LPKKSKGTAPAGFSLVFREETLNSGTWRERPGGEVVKVSDTPPTKEWVEKTEQRRSRKRGGGRERWRVEGTARNPVPGGGATQAQVTHRG